MNFDPVLMKWAEKRGANNSGGSSGGGDTGGGSGEEWIGDGNTHIWISLADGRTSPMVGLGVNGTVTVDWGDGTAPSALTGTSTSTVVCTPNHAYSKPGDYVITLTVEGACQISGWSNGTHLLCAYYESSGITATRNAAYSGAIKKVEVGNNVSIGSYAFVQCAALSSLQVSEPESAYGTSLTGTFKNCSALVSVYIPDGVRLINTDAFAYCGALASVRMPESVTSISGTAFNGCSALASIHIPDAVTSISNSVFGNCDTLAAVRVPPKVTRIQKSTFTGCVGVAYYDFSRHTAVPTLDNTNAFYNIQSDCQIRVPAALANEWKAAANWSTYASYIVGV